MFSVNLSRTFFQCFLAVRKTAACLLVSCNTSWGLSIQQSLAESFIKLESYKENAQCESERAVANSRVARWLFEALLNSCPGVEGPRQRRQTQGTFKRYNSIIFTCGPPWLFLALRPRCSDVSFYHRECNVKSRNLSKGNRKKLLPLHPQGRS